MRGKIIFYNQNEGKGIIVSEGVQYPFSILSWVSDTAPNPNTSVDFELDESNSILSVGLPTAAEMPDLPPPTLAGVAKKVSDRFAPPAPTAGPVPSAPVAGGAVQPVATATPAIGASSLAASLNAQNIMATLGREALAAQVLYIVAVMALPFVDKITSLVKPAIGTSLWDLTSDKMTPDFAGGFSMLFWVSIISILVPVFWRNKLAWLALLVPLAVVVRGFFLIAKINNGIQFSPDATTHAETFVKTINESATHTAPLDLVIDTSFYVALLPSYGIWVAGAAALVVALLGLLKFRQFK